MLVTLLFSACASRLALKSAIRKAPALTARPVSRRKRRRFGPRCSPSRNDSRKRTLAAAGRHSRERIETLRRATRAESASAIARRSFCRSLATHGSMGYPRFSRPPLERLSHSAKNVRLWPKFRTAQEPSLLGKTAIAGPSWPGSRRRSITAATSGAQIASGTSRITSASFARSTRLFSSSGAPRVFQNCSTADAAAIDRRTTSTRPGTRGSGASPVSAAKRQ